MAQRTRSVVFTVNARHGEELELLDPGLWGELCDYCVYSREYATHEHFQGYMELSRATSWNTLHLLDGLEDAHFEHRRGSQAQAVAYASKRDDPTFLEGPFEYGVKKAQGQRTELQHIQTELNNGTSLKQIAQDNFPEWCRFGKCFTAYKLLISPKRDWQMDVQIYIGPTGCGKTRLAYDQYGESLYPQLHGKWFDGYDGEETVLIDEYDEPRFTWAFLLQLLDRYPMTVESKGTIVPFISRRVILTSNSHPSTWYPTHDYAPLERRTTLLREWSFPIIPQFIDQRGNPASHSRLLNE